MKKLYLLTLLFIASFSAAQAQVSITASGTALPEDFNTLVATGTSTAVPAGWSFIETGANGNATYTAGTGSSNTGDTYSFGAAGNTERAFGTLRSGNVIPIIGVAYTNNTNSAITSFSVTYNGEEWRLGAAGRADRLDFQYSLNAISVNSGTWVDVNELDFSTPVTTGTVGVLNGNVAPNRTAISFTVTGVSIPAAATFYFRWVDIDVVGNDDGLAIDDYSATFISTAIPPCAEPGAQPSDLQFANVTANSISGSFTTIPAPTTVENYLVIRSASSTLSALPVDGTTYAAGATVNGGNGVSVGISSDGTFTDNNLTPNTAYYYFIFALNDQACSGAPNYEQTIAPLTGTTSTLALAPCVTPAAPTGLMFTSSNTTISGSFTGSGASRYLVLRNTTGSFTGTVNNGTVYTAGSTIGNATVVSYATGTTFNSSGLTINTQYYFYVFAANDACTGEPAYSTTSLNGTFSTTNNPGGIPAGYYSSITNQTCAPLKTALYNIIRPTVANPAPDYAGICNIYTSTDYKVSDFSSNMVIWDMYSDNPTGPDPYEFEYGIDVDGCGGNSNNPAIPGSAEGIEYNREHSFPRNWFGGTVEPMNSDIMHIFPTDKEVNARRGNLPFGKTTAPTFTSLNGSKVGPNSTAGFSGIVFEPIDTYKGDFARGQFYMITAYENLVAGWETNKPEIFNGTSYQAFDPWYLNLMYQWHTADPVSQKEIDRNNAVYTIQGNRNPYVDHPEYVQAAFTCTGVIPVKILSFSGALSNNNATLRWKVTNEDAFAKYGIERSTDGIKFDQIGVVAARNATAYDFTDIKTPAVPVVYYRLKLIDIDNEFVYSNTITLRPDMRSRFTISPNPARNIVQVKTAAVMSGESTMIITDMSGRVLQTRKIAAGTNNFTIDVRSLSAGRYVLLLNSASGASRESFVVLP